MHHTSSGPNRGPISDLSDSNEASSAAFLALPRAALLCAREFDRLSDRVAVLMTADASSNAARNAEVRRTPGRCIVQLGPVGLTVSWVRARVDTVAEGRLLVIEWLGAVARGVGLVPIQSIQSEGQRTARLLSEIVFRAAAVSEREWFWRDEANLHMRYRSEDLADHCAGSLRATLQRVEGR